MTKLMHNFVFKSKAKEGFFFCVVVLLKTLPFPTQKARLSFRSFYEPINPDIH